MLHCGLAYLDLCQKVCMVTADVFTVFQQKKSKDHFGLEGDEESTMLEDSVSPKK